MPQLEEAARTRDVTVSRSFCGGDPADPEVEARYELVLVRRGTFRREIDSGIAVVDPTTAYVARPGQWQQIHHVGGHGDAGHLVSFSSRLLLDDAERLPTAPVRLTPAVDLAVRRLAAAAEPDALAVEETVAAILASLLAPRGQDHTGRRWATAV